MHVTEAREISASGEAGIPTVKWRVRHPPCESCQLTAAAPEAEEVEPICLCPPPHTHHPVGGDHSPTVTRPPASGRTLREGRGSGGPHLGSKSPWGCLAAIQNVQKGPSQASQLR